MRNSIGSAIPLFKIKFEEKGKIKDIKEMIVRIDGLSSCLYGQLVSMGDDVKGIIMGFDEENVLALVLGDQGRLRMGQPVSGVSEPFRIPVGHGFVGRMVSAMGEPCDHRGDVEPDDYLPVLRDSIPITGRDPLSDFLETGTKIVDSLMPLAKGQRQLILGDRMTGKTVIAIDAILNQKGKDVVCIYCCIGKSISGLQKTLSIMHDSGALDYTVVVAANDNAPVGEQYLVPFSAAAMAEYFVSKGEDVLVIFDDLTKHAWAYRQLSLLLDRPPGREAYPGDVFYVQTQLMERAGRFNEEHGGGTMTFLCLAETQQGDLTGYIPSNLVSMCDGQIYLNSSIFAEGFRPAIDLNLSLSIVGGKVQPAMLKALSMDLSADYARYTEVLKLSRVSSGLSEESERIVRKGEAIRSMLQQDQYKPVSIAEQIILLHAIQTYVLEGLSDDEKGEFRDGVYAYVHQHNAILIDKLNAGGEMTPKISAGLDEVIAAFLKDQATEE